MADLQAMFQNLGPTGGALMSGIQMGQQYNANESEQALRQLQMEKIAQETRQAEEMNPLLLQGKQQELSSAKLKAEAEQHAYHTKVLGDVIPELERQPKEQRLSFLQNYSAKRGVPLDEEDLAHFSQDPDIVTTLKSMHTWGVTQSREYRQAMDVAELNRKSAERVAAGNNAATRYSADSRAQLAKDRANADKSLSQDLSAAKNYQAQAVVYTNHAEKARLSGDDSEYLRLSELAKQATAQDLQAKSAAGDARAAQQLQLLQGLGVQLNNMPSASPAAPASAAGPRKPIGSY